MEPTGKVDADTRVMSIRNTISTAECCSTVGAFGVSREYRALKATECAAEIMPDGTTNWFGRYLPSGLVLGDPGARDAASTPSGVRTADHAPASRRRQNNRQPERPAGG